MLDNVVKQLELLPNTYKDFYARLAVQKLKKKCYTEEQTHKDKVDR